MRARERTGLVSLVGAGPGDPELMTLRALRRLEEAEAVVYDRLVAPELLDYCAPHVQLYDVGKVPGRHSTGRQGEINDLLVSLGQAGLRVVRLKGGDPFVFGRGGEEALALAAAGVPYEVVPGISSALAAPAAAGIPVTHRGMSTSVTIATGHDGRGVSSTGHDWEALARMQGTLVFLMAVETLESIVGRLIEHGRPLEEPAALVHWATTPMQRTVTAPLGEIVVTGRTAGIESPAVLVVGPTVALAHQIGSVGSLLELPGLCYSAA